MKPTYKTPYSYQTAGNAVYNTDTNEWEDGSFNTVSGYCVFSGGKGTIQEHVSGRIIQVSGILTTPLPISAGFVVSVAGDEYTVYSCSPVIDGKTGIVNHYTSQLIQSGDNHES
jgi:hypothetical protein